MRISLRFKIIFLIVLVEFLVMSILIFQIVRTERKNFSQFYEEKAKILTTALNASIGKKEYLTEVDVLYSSINKFLWLYPDISEISIFAPSPEGLKVVASNRTQRLGETANLEQTRVFNEGKTFIKSIVLQNKSKGIEFIAPIHFGGQISGIYEIIFSLEHEEKNLQKYQREIIGTFIYGISVIILLLYIFLNTFIIRPISEIEKGLKIIGQGNLQWRLKLKSKDEMEELAKGINEMTAELQSYYSKLEEEVKKKTQELGEAKTVLEIRVEARTKELKEIVEKQEELIKDKTKELREKIRELEEFQKVAVGRELKMLELKKQIAELQGKLKKTEEGTTKS